MPETQWDEVLVQFPKRKITQHEEVKKYDLEINAQLGQAKSAKGQETSKY